MVKMSQRFCLSHCACLIVVVLVIGMALSVYADNVKLTLVKGSNNPINLNYDIGKIAIGDPMVCDFIVSTTRKEVILSPKTRGTTNLIIWDNEGIKRDSIEIVVVENIKRLADDLTALFRDIEGVKITSSDTRLIISGNVYSETDYNYVKRAVEGVPELVQFRLSLDPEALRLLAREIEKAIQRAEISTRVIKDMILLEGFVFSKFEYERAERIATTYSANRIINALEIRDHNKGRAFRADKLVHFDVKFLEVNDNVFSRFGINWSDTILASDTTRGYRDIGDGARTDIYGKTEAIITGLLPSIDILVNDGGAKQIANPRLICKSGEKGREVVDGGLYPVIVVTQFEVKIEYREFGIIVEMEPIVSDNKLIDSKIKVSVIQVGRIIEKDNVSVPLFDMDEVETSVLLREGETLILGGLVNKRKAEMMSGLPGLSRIPLLKYLFGSKEKEWLDTSMVVLVTPTILEAGSIVQETDTRLRKRLENTLSIQDEFSIP